MPTNYATGDGIGRFIRDLRPDMTVRQLANRLGLHRYSVMRMLNKMSSSPLQRWQTFSTYAEAAGIELVILFRNKESGLHYRTFRSAHMAAGLSCDAIAQLTNRHIRIVYKFRGNWDYGRIVRLETARLYADAIGCELVIYARLQSKNS